MYSRYDVGPIQSTVLNDPPSPSPKDLSAVLWLTFEHVTNSIAEDISWRNSFFQQSSRPRFLYSADMRKRILQYVDNFDQRLSRGPLPLTWTSILERSGGLYSFVRATAK